MGGKSMVRAKIVPGSPMPILKEAVLFTTWNRRASQLWTDAFPPLPSVAYQLQWLGDESHFFMNHCVGGEYAQNSSKYITTSPRQRVECTLGTSSIPGHGPLN